jgi:hypothetical protein
MVIFHHPLNLEDFPSLFALQGCSLFHEFADNAPVFDSGHDLLNHICASGNHFVIHGYLINSYCFRTSAAQLCLIWSLSIVVAIVI